MGLFSGIGSFFLGIGTSSYDKEEEKRKKEEEKNAKLNNFSIKKEFEKHEKEEDLDLNFLSDMRIKERKIDKSEVNKKLDEMLKKL